MAFFLVVLVMDLKSETPTLPNGSPMCGPFSSLSNINNERRGDNENMTDTLREAIVHPTFTFGAI